jgi:hypothetical protein
MSLTQRGIWVVTTEGDCEGRSTRNLGIYNGVVEEIALHLADKVEYQLNFSEYKSPMVYVGPYIPKREQVQLTMGYGKPVLLAQTKDKRLVKLGQLQNKSVALMTEEEKKLVGEALMKGEL